MSNARRIADLLDSSGDVLGTNLDNVTTYSVGDGGLTTNDFTDADHTKLNAIEASATADQTGAEIKTAYEAEANAYTDTKDTKLSGIATSANNYSHPSGAGNSHIPTGGSVDQLLTNTASGTGTWQDAPVSLPSQTGNANKQLTTDGSTASWADTSITLDAPSITGTLSVDSGGTVSHTISNWSDDVSYTITPTNCTVGAVNSSGVFVVTHTSGTPSYTIVATTDSLGLADSSVVTKNMVVKLTAPTISSPADTTVTTNVVYTVTSTDSNDDKIILDMGTSSFTFGSVSVGSGTKVGNTVEVTGFTTNNPAITVQFTALGTYSSVKAKSTKIDASYGDSDYSSTDSILIYEQLSAPSLNAPADVEVDTAVTYTISSIDSNATKVIFDTQSSNFTYGSVGSGSGSKVGNTVEITGWTGTSVTVTLTYTTAATYSNRAKVQSTADAYTDSAYSSTDSIIISSPAVWYGDRGVWMGGYVNAGGVANVNTIDYISISTPANATDFGDLSAARGSTTSCSSVSRGFCAGGKEGGTVNTIEYITFASTGNATDWGDLNVTYLGRTSAGNGTRGLTAGGETTDAVDYFSLTSAGNASDFGNLSGSRRESGSIANSTRFVVAGGVTVNVIEYFTIASTGNATDFGDLLTAQRDIGGGISSETRGIFQGDGVPTNVIQYITIGSTGNATDFGDMTLIRNVEGTGDGTTGVIGGGGNGAAGTETNVIDKITIATTGNAVDFGDLTQARNSTTATSGD